MQTAKCPHCKEEITRLFFVALVKEYGNCLFDGDVQEVVSSDTEDIVYECPECGKEVYLEDFKEKDEEEPNT